MSDLRKIKIATHNGPFHCDDIFAVATLCLHLGEDKPFEIIRTRDDTLIKEADYVVDVGGGFDVERKIFDHHQNGGVGKRENGIPFASFGLVWRTYGIELCGSREVAEAVDKKLVQPIDAEDNGVKVSKGLFEGITSYTLQDLFFAFAPTWKEDETDMNLIFKNFVAMAKLIINREIRWTQDKIDSEIIVKDFYENSTDKRLVVLEKYYPWKSILVHLPEPLYIIYPNEIEKTWHLRAVPLELDSFSNRKPLPESWAGERSENLAEISGVADSIFCHKNRHMAVAKSKEGVINMAMKAIYHN